MCFGITRFARDPMWFTLQTLKPTLRVIFICSSAFMKASFQQSLLQIKTPAGAGVCLRVCGERGIRTLGPDKAGQRFSRPPRSTTPASLQIPCKDSMNYLIFKE